MRDSYSLRNPVFLPDLYSFCVFCGIFGLPIGVAPQYKMGSCWPCGSRMWHFPQLSSLHGRPSIGVGRVKHCHHIVWFPASYDSCFYVSIFLVSSGIFLFVFKVWCHHVKFSQSSHSEFSLRRSTTFL